MARTRTAKHPKQEEIPVEDISQEEPEEEETPDNGQPAIKKADMVRAAIAEGITTPTEGVAFIKAKFGIDLPKPMWSSYLAGFKRREGGVPTHTRSSSPQPAAIPASFGQDIKTIKELIERLGGGDAVKDMANTLADLKQKYGAGLDSLIDAFE